MRSALRRAFLSTAASVLWVASRIPVLRDGVIAGLEWRTAGTPFGRRHPFDVQYGVRTSGVVPAFALTEATGIAYAAAQPSIMRKALAAIPNVERFHFIDFGCGKGRPLLIAREIGFRAVTGVEYSPTLVRVARGNAAIFARQSPNGPRIDVVQADATTYILPTESLVLFFYNTFSDMLMAKVIAGIERSLAAAPRDLFVVAYNPVAAPLLDASAAFERFYAAQIPYAQEELGFGPDRDDAVVIWCNKGNPTPHQPGDRLASVTVLSHMRAVLSAHA